MPALIVLLIEPDPVRRVEIARALGELKVEVRSETSWHEVTNVAAGDVVVASVLDSDSTLVEALGALRAAPDTADHPVVALVPPGASSRAIEAGADDALEWPADPALVRARLRMLGNGAAARTEIRQLVAALSAVVDAVEAREPVRIEHSRRVAALCEGAARLSGLAEAECKRLWLGGLLHDVGIVAIPDGILFKTAPLTAAELALVKTHPVIGFEMLRGIPSLEPILPFVLRHHEKIDGSGYPDGLSGREIPLPVQILSIADAYDAMTSARPYRSVRSRGSTLEILASEAARGLWDPELISLIARASQATEKA